MKDNNEFKLDMKECDVETIDILEDPVAPVFGIVCGCGPDRFGIWCG